MKTNIFLFGLVLFIVSLIITLNIFFMQTYQGEIAEQFNRQQLLVARSIAKNIEEYMQHLEEEALSFASLVSDKSLDDNRLGEFVNNAWQTVRDNIHINIKILGKDGRLRYSSFTADLTPLEQDVLETARKIPQGKTQFIDRIADERKIILLVPIEQKTVLKGVLIMEIMLDGLNKRFVSPIRSGMKGHAWMMDSSGTLLYHPTQAGMVGKNLYKADRSCFQCHTSFDVEKSILASGDVGYSTYIAPYGEDKLVAFSRARISTFSWYVCVSVPYSEITFSIRKSMRLHSLLVISIFIATITGAFAIIAINRKRIKAEEKAKYFETQQQLEKEIIETKDYLENVLESTESKIMVLDRDFRVRMINSAQERLCGQNKEGVAGKDFFEVSRITKDAERFRIQKILNQCLEGQSHRLSNFPYIRDDRTLHLNISFNPLILHGSISGVIVSSSDVTEEVSLKTKLQEYALKLEEMVVKRTDELMGEKEKLNVIVETLSAGLCLANSSGTIIWTNRTLREWLGQDVEVLTLDALYGKDSIQRAIVDNKKIQEVIYHNFGNRKGFFQITSTLILSLDGTYQILVLIQDITEMKKMEERMMQSEKLSALARISAGVAHEIGNPLTSISSYVQILREMDFDEFTKESLNTIAKHITRITDIVRQMSSFSRTVSSDLRPHKINNLINQTLDLVKYDKRLKNIQIRMEIPGDLPDVRIDETQSIQVFMNIILNAADTMPEGGTLDIAAHVIDKEVEIAFSDTGPGVPIEHAEKIFDPFFTTKEKGTGLGLAVSYNIIKSYHGDILVENKPEGGAVFKVRIPVYEI